MPAVSLHYRYFGGEGHPPLVILHGLLGSSRNWQAAGRDIAEHFEVFAVDLRGHGDSPHDPDLSFEACAADALAFLDERGLEKAVLCGHSFGGKIALRAATNAPERVPGLIVADIAPRAYAPHYKEEIDALLALDLDSLKNRSEAEKAVAEQIPDLGFRRFLLTNLARDEESGYRWQCDLERIREGLESLRGNSLGEEEAFEGPALFVIGGQSGFVRAEDAEIIRHHCPNARCVTLEKAGHNVHADDREGFVRAVAACRDWLRGKGEAPGIAGPCTV